MQAKGGIVLYPCPQCQKLYMPGRPCPSCGYMPIDHGAAIVSWLSTMTPEQRRAAIAAEPAEYWPQSLTRSYPGRDPASVVPRRDYEAALLAEAGYYLVSQGWGGGGASVGDVVMFGVIGALRQDTTALIVTYQRHVPPNGGG